MILRTVVLGLGWFAAINGLASLIVWLVASRGSWGRFADRPLALLALRMFPATASILFVAVAFLPAHWAFEPRDASETLGNSWYALAVLGALLLVRSGARAARVAQSGRRLGIVRAAGSPIQEIDGFPGVSLVGVIRPRILIGSAVAARLTPAELDVAIAHEIAHRRALDNPARCAMLCAPDLFGPSGAARRLEAAWHAAAESVADARAAAGDRVRAVNLASALVKVARLSESDAAPAANPAWSTLNDPLLLEVRVHRLLAGPMQEQVRPRSLVPPAIAVAAGAVLPIAAPAAAAALHRATEALIVFLP